MNKEFKFPLNPINITGIKQKSLPKMVEDALNKSITQEISNREQEIGSKPIPIEIKNANDEIKLPKKIGFSTDQGKIVDGVIHRSIGGVARDTNDHAKLRQGRERNLGFHLSSYLQPAPLVFTRDGHALYIGDTYRGRAAFLVASGPSFKEVDKTKLAKAGVLTMGLNNSPKSFRPNLWTSVDDPTHFMKSIWLDPKITKYVPFCHSEKFIFDNESWTETQIRVGDCPNTFFYRRNEYFSPERFLFEDTINWGNHSDLDGGRSVMLAAMRILFFLGVRHLFLLGCDFKMDENTKYHFEQDRSKGSISNNNDTYKKLNERFSLLRPIFERHEFFVYNCYKESGLTVFDYMSFDDAIEFATSEMPKDIENERTAGLYERISNLKKGKIEMPPVSKTNITNTKSDENCDGCGRTELLKKKTKEQLDTARSELNSAKQNLEEFLLKIGVSQAEEDLKKKAELEDIVKEKRSVFKQKEEAKNLAWYGTKKAPEKAKE